MTYVFSLIYAKMLMIIISNLKEKGDFMKRVFSLVMRWGPLVYGLYRRFRRK